MKCAVWLCLCLSVPIGIGACQCVTQEAEPPAESAGSETKSAPDPEEDPLLLEDAPLLLEDAPLLLDNPGGAVSHEGPMADNSRCHVCHMNFEVEELSVTHARADVGCEDCHGSCDAHCSDEDNITPPDRMYPEEKINASCLECHPDLPEDSDHEAFVKGTAEKGEHCTDCHGEHRMRVRTRRWNKTTGELLQDDKVRMMTDDLLEEEK